MMTIYDTLDLHQPCFYKYDWAFRVVGDGPNGNHSSFDEETDSLVARAPSTPVNMDAVENHLLWQPRPSPFMSVYTLWRKALHRAQWLCDRGAQNVRIYVIDMEEVAITSPGLIAFDATSLATKLGFRALTPWQKGNRSHLPQWLNRQNLDNHESELLIYRAIPDVSITVLAVIPSDGPTLRFPVHLGVMEVPTKFVEWRQVAAQSGVFRQRDTIDAIENLEQDICSDDSPARKVYDIVFQAIDGQLQYGPRWSTDTILFAMQAMLIENWSYV